MGRTLVIIKPDAVERHLIGEIIKRFETAGFIVDGIKMLRLRPEDARRFYAVHEGKPFLNELCEYMSSGPIVPMIIKSDGETFARVRKFIGATDPAKAEPGTIRRDLAINMTKNSVHASDSSENAEIEIKFFFG
ncbi:MAG: nucleoside-diphosphate kinase [candidate division Zixibacteria bacterium]|nr:nucleoside-diphosphate kinase [candidate division Zixibacteria bacterium]